METLRRSEGAPASLTEAGIVLGTLNYMAPEQANGEPVDHRADIFSFGVMLYEMVTGDLPFRGANTAAVIHQLYYGTARPLAELMPGVPDALETIVGRAMAKRADDRYSNMPALASDLRALAARLDAVEAEASTPEAANGATGVVVADVPRTEARSSARLPRPPSTGSERASIAVLPFTSLSSDKEDGYLAGGISAELIGALSGVPDLRVASHLASFRFHDTPDLQVVADTLNIRYVLTGSLRRAGNRIRVMAELTDAQSGEQLWARTYERAVEDVFAVQEEIARRDRQRDGRRAHSRRVRAREPYGARKPGRLGAGAPRVSLLEPRVHRRRRRGRARISSAGRWRSTRTTRPRGRFSVSI